MTDWAAWARQPKAKMCFIMMFSAFCEAAQYIVMWFNSLYYKLI